MDRCLIDENLWRSGFQRLHLFVKGIPTTLRSSNLSPRSYWLSAMTSTPKPCSSTYTMRLVVSAAISTCSYHSARAPVWTRYPKFIPFSTISNLFVECALPISATPKYLKPLTKPSSRMATVLPTGLIIFCRCYDGTSANVISSQELVYGT